MIYIVFRNIPYEFGEVMFVSSDYNKAKEYFESKREHADFKYISIQKWEENKEYEYEEIGE